MTQVVKVEGLREMREALFRTVPQEMQGKVLQRALAAGARPIVAAAKALVPVRSGRIKRSIFSFRDKRNSNGVFEARSIRPRQGKKFQKSNRDAYYWKFVELGHRIGRRGRGYLKKTGRRSQRGAEAIGVVPPRPFMRPAFEAQKGAALTAIVDRLKTELAAAARKARWGDPRKGGARAASRALRDVSSVLSDLAD